MMEALPKYQANTVFLSDIHLGSASCHAESVNEFLQSIECKQLYLVGDIIDLWAIKRRRSGLCDDHLKVIKTLLSMARQGTEIYYITGNHDEGFRLFLKDYPFDKGLTNITLCNQHVYTSAAGLRYLVLHGDQFDKELQCHRWLNLLGDTIYGGLLRINRWWNKIRTRQGYGYWSLASAVKSKSARALQYIQDYEQAATTLAQRKGYDGIICGHIHIPADKQINGVHYLNTGDWQDSCSALIEHRDGSIELLCAQSWLRSRANSEVLLAQVI